MHIFPRDGKFFDLFQAAAGNIETAAVALHELMTEFDDLAGRARRLKEIEDKGDEITHEVHRRLNTIFVTPIDREDIYAITTALDDVVDHIEACAARIELYGFDRSTAPAREFADVILQGAREVKRVLAILPHPDPERVHAYTVELNRLENEGDRILRTALRDLFHDQHDPVTIIKWKEIYEFLEMTTDAMERVANLVESVVMKSA